MDREFGDILKAIRCDRGLSQDELAAQLGTTKQVISRYETKKRVPRVSVVHEYAQKLGVPFSVFSGESHARAVEPPVSDAPRSRLVPVLGSAACGEPIYKPGDGTEFISVDESILCDYALIAEGDSMIGDRIHSGDVVFIRAQSHVQDGEIAAVAIDDEITLKRIRRLRMPDGRVAFTQLLPSNPAYSPIEIGGEDETRFVNIIGKAVAVRFEL